MAGSDFSCSAAVTEVSLIGPTCLHRWKFHCLELHTKNDVDDVDVLRKKQTITKAVMLEELSNLTVKGKQVV